MNLINTGLIALVTLLLSGAAAASPTEENHEHSHEPLPVYDQWGGDFSLTDANGLALKLSDFKGKVVLLNFGFTHCPDICPTTMFTLQKVVKKMAAQADQVQVLFITLDPERDHPERLKAYTEHFNHGFIALSGSLAQIEQVAERYGMKFEKENFDDEGGYSIAHTNVIYLIDKQGRLRVFFKTHAPAARIAEDVKKLLDE